MSRLLLNYSDVLVERPQDSLNFGEIQAQKDLEEFKENLIESFNEGTVSEQITCESLERVESKGIKDKFISGDRDSLKYPNPVKLADSFKELVDICDYSEPTDAVELKQLARERRL